MEDRFEFRIPIFTDKGRFIEFEYRQLGDFIDVPLAGYTGEPQQCTGLKDKNGKFIYEKDIIKDTHGRIFEVCFNKEYVGFVLEDKKLSIITVFGDTKNLEVIDNVL